MQHGKAAEWLREHRHVDVGGSGSSRISASITHADDDETERALVDALRALIAHADDIGPRPPFRLPEPAPTRRACRWWHPAR
ncbi:hypothetical protein ACPXCS_27670 [Streptomyces sp. DT190]|uniref:hypothetical protein n=1 Tax=unclassified Streptomyces TaxID=2593676 RepID=UPI003CF5050B